MEIESLRLDFLTLIITKPQNNSRAYQRRKKKKKKQKNPGSALPRSRGRALPGLRVAWAVRCPGRARPRQHAQAIATAEEFWLFVWLLRKS